MPLLSKIFCVSISLLSNSNLPERIFDVIPGTPQYKVIQPVVCVFRR